VCEIKIWNFMCSSVDLEVARRATTNVTIQDCAADVVVPTHGWFSTGPIEDDGAKKFTAIFKTDIPNVARGLPKFVTATRQVK
jgi:hypothetical protein